MPNTSKDSALREPKVRCSNLVVRRAFDLIEALEQEPHMGMEENETTWKAYANLVRALGGKPMRKWWEHRNRTPHNIYYKAKIPD